MSSYEKSNFLNNVQYIPKVDREWLDVSNILSPGANHLLYHGRSRGLYFTISDKDLTKACFRFEKLLKPQLKLHIKKLIEWSNEVKLANSDAARNAINSLISSVTATVMKKAHEQGPKTDSAIFQNNSIMFKAFEKYAKELISSEIRSGRVKKTRQSSQTHEMFQLLHQCMSEPTETEDILADKVKVWLEKEGFKPWSSSLKPSLDNSLKEVFYLTEADIKEAHRAAGEPRPRNTPDFMFVDIHKKPVQIPVLLKARKLANSPYMSGESQNTLQPDFWVTVIEVKGHLILPGITGDDNDMERVAHQLHRYCNEVGPTLMLQSRGMSERVLKYVMEEHAVAEAEMFSECCESPSSSVDEDASLVGEKKACQFGPYSNLLDGIAVVTFDAKKLPSSKLAEPFDVISDNYDYDYTYHRGRGTALEKRLEKTKFPHKTSGHKELLENFAYFDHSCRYLSFAHDMEKLRCLRKEAFNYTEKHFDTYTARKQDIYLFHNWEGRLFQEVVTEARDCLLTKEERDRKESSSAEEQDFFFLQEDLADDWEDRVDLR